ncbi:hypothetical protein [Novipirellula galeiformis]|uniref:hypothetical protein n=1 Tax=Novipirellula galeiformis TaxID=2528004 RepID=UPI0018CE3B07|nr:hypothetical protein [Novipirellula galeiformis]
MPGHDPMDRMSRPLNAFRHPPEGLRVVLDAGVYHGQSGTGQAATLSGWNRHD